MKLKEIVSILEGIHSLIHGKSACSACDSGLLRSKAPDLLSAVKSLKAREQETSSWAPTPFEPAYDTHKCQWVLVQHCYEDDGDIWGPSYAVVSGNGNHFTIRRKFLAKGPKEAATE